MRPLSEAEIGWLAGIIDGEGAVVFRQAKGKKQPNNQLYLQVSNSSPRLIRKFVALAGGHPYLKSIDRRQPKGRRMYDVRIGGDTLRWLLPILIPHLTCKKPQAQIALKMARIMGIRHRPGPGNSRRRFYGLAWLQSFNKRLSAMKDFREPLWRL